MRFIIFPTFSHHFTGVLASPKWISPSSPAWNPAETAGRKKFHIRVWIDDIEIPKCQHALPNALHLGVFKKSLSLGFSFQPGCAKYSHRTRICADVLSLSPKMPLLEVADMLMQDHKTLFVQKSTSQVS